MGDITVYMIVNLKINDADEYKIYEKGFFTFLKKHNGSFITFDDSPLCLITREMNPVNLIESYYFLFHLKMMLIIGGMILGIKNYVNIEELVLK